MLMVIASSVYGVFSPKELPLSKDSEKVGVPNWTRGSSGEVVGVGDTVAVGVAVAVVSGMGVKVAVISSVATACSV